MIKITGSEKSLRELSLLFSFITLVSIALLFLGFDSVFIISLFVLPTFIILIIDYKSFKYFFILSIFTNYFLLGFYFSVYVAYGLVLSFIINHHFIEYRLFKNPLKIPLIIYYLTIIPSIFSSSNFLLTLYLMFNLHAFVLVIYLFGYSIDDNRKIFNVIYAFLLFLFLDALIIIVKSILFSGREFGIAGVVFVDFSAIGIIILSLFTLFKWRNKQLVYSVLLFILLIALLFTQTRNTFISLILTFITVLIYLISKSEFLEIEKTRLIKNVLAIIFISAITLSTLLILTPDIFNRFGELSDSKILNVKSESDFGTNSLLSRVLIWDTAWNAFKTSPITGIGIYSFPFQAVNHYSIPKYLFKQFVEGVSPHITFLAVLTETGILGLFGFLVLLISVIKIAFSSIRKSITKNHKFTSVLLASINIYIFFSMFLTDAWLWGQCGMLWSIILGLTIANYKLVEINSQALQ